MLSKLMKLDVKEVKKRAKNCAEETIKLAYTYGALMLSPYLDASLAPLLTTEKALMPVNEPNDAIQLKTLRELTALTHEKADINLIMQKSLQGIYTGVGMDRVLVLLLNREKTQLQPRFALSLDEGQLKEVFVVDLTGVRSIFNHCLQSQETLWIKSHTDPRWNHLLSAATKAISCARGFFLSPIEIDKQSIGLFYADRAASGRELESEDYFNFIHFVQQTNLCLTNIMRGK